MSSVAGPVVHKEVNEVASAEQNGLFTRLATAAGLGVLAVVGYEAQRRGITYELPAEPKVIVDSFKHPIVGYAGAWIGSIVARKYAPSHENSVMVAGATVSNFGAEGAQSLVLAIDEYRNFLAPHQLLETAKDYAFALGGYALFATQRRKPTRDRLDSQDRV